MQDLTGMYPLCMIAGSSGQGMILPLKDWFLGGTIYIYTEKKEIRIRRTAVAHRTVSEEEIRAEGGISVTQGTVTNRLLQGQLRARLPVACTQATAVCNSSGIKPELIGECSADLLCFLRKACSALVPEMAMCWSKGGQGSVCNQTICGLDTLDLRLESWSGERFLIYMTAGALSWIFQTH
ncbi:HTH_Tnp_Tc3_2 domain-containing protein [Trichonephila clavipes]|nr:HTH_Tnp_Tc3_2 domain-containing protein [Trichonephila clavipes]